MWGDHDSYHDSESEGFGGRSHDSDPLHGPFVKYRTVYVKHPSTMARRLYDVNGRLIETPTGKPANLYSLEFKEMLDKKKIRCIHNVRNRPGYRYFVTYKAQQDMFIEARDSGFSTVRQAYHVYPDEPGLVLPHESPEAFVGLGNPPAPAVRMRSNVSTRW